MRQGTDFRISFTTCPNCNLLCPGDSVVEGKCEDCRFPGTTPQQRSCLRFMHEAISQGRTKFFMGRQHGKTLALEEAQRVAGESAIPPLSELNLALSKVAEDTDEKETLR